MITSGYLIVFLGAAAPAIIRAAARGLWKCGKALLAAMRTSREHEAMRVIVRHRDLIDPDAVIIFEPSRAPEAGARDTADRRDHLLTFGQTIPFQSTARPHVPRIGGRALGNTWRGAQ